MTLQHKGLISIAWALQASLGLASLGCSSESDSGGTQTAGQSGIPATPGGADSDVPSVAQIGGGSNTGPSTAASGGAGKSGSGGSPGATTPPGSSGTTLPGGIGAAAGSTGRVPQAGAGSLTGGTGSIAGGGAAAASAGNAAAGASAGSSAAGGTSDGCTSFGTPTSAGAMKTSTLATASQLNQISGIVASRDNDNVIYAQADSGDSTVFVMNGSGEPLGAISLPSITAVDWEDLSIGVNASGTDQIYVADIGDNAARTGSGNTRASIAVYRFPEPAKTAFSTASAVTVSTTEVAKLAYPNGAHDAETLVVDPKTQDLLIVTKDNDGKAIIYRAPTTAFGAATTTTLEQVAQISTGTASQMSSQVSAGDISPSGDRILLRTYGSILLFPRQSTWADTFAATPITVPSPTEKQSEGLTFNSQGTAWLSAGETSATIYIGESSCK